MSNIKKGDVVRIKGQYVVMTVTSNPFINQGDIRGILYVQVTWFDVYNHIQSTAIRPELLEKVDAAVTDPFNP